MSTKVGSSGITNNETIRHEWIRIQAWAVPNGPYAGISAYLKSMPAINWIGIEKVNCANKRVIKIRAETHKTKMDGRIRWVRRMDDFIDGWYLLGGVRVDRLRSFRPFQIYAIEMMNF